MTVVKPKSFPGRDPTEIADRLHSAAIHLLRRVRVRDRESGIDPEYDEHGSLYVAFDEAGGARLRSRFRWQREAGAQEHQAVRDVGGGKLIASVRDADGNLIGLMQTPSA